MSDSLPPCPECASTFCYQMDALLICPECGHEWAPGALSPEAAEVRDSVGNVLRDGDTVTVIKDLKVKGSSSVVKVGTKVRNIRSDQSPAHLEKRWAMQVFGMASEFHNGKV